MHRGRSQTLLIGIFIFSGFVLNQTNAQFIRSGAPRGELLNSARAIAGPDVDHWTIEADSETGAITRLEGMIKTDGSTIHERYKNFVERYGFLLDIDADAGLTAPIAGTRLNTTKALSLRSKQEIHGFQCKGYGLTVLFDENGNIRGAHGIVVPKSRRPAPPRFAPGDALRMANEHWKLRGVAAASWRTAPRVGVKIVDFTTGAARLCYQIDGILSNPLTPVSVLVDADTGSILREFNNYSSGTGEYHHNNTTSYFKTGGGKGTVYTDIYAARYNSYKNVALADVAAATAVPSLAENGMLYGKYAQIIDEGAWNDQTTYFSNVDINIFDLKHNFKFSPLNASTYDRFDATNVYYHISKFAKAMSKLFIFSPAFYSIPVVTNVKGLENAFFTTGDLGIGGSPGFMAFGDLTNTTGDFGDDFGRDPSIIYHEYTHALMHFENYNFGAVSGSPAKGLNEAIADYYSAIFTKDPRIGYALAGQASPMLMNTFGMTTNGLRNLSEPRELYTEWPTIISSGNIEEHDLATVIGSTLWDVRNQLGTKLGDKVIRYCLDSWPESTAEVGFPTISSGNAYVATKAYLTRLASVLYYESWLWGNTTKAGRVLGSCLAHGLTGVDDGVGPTILFDGTNGLNLKFDSAMLGNTPGHFLAIKLNGGQKLSVQMTAYYSYVDPAVYIANSSGFLTAPNAYNTDYASGFPLSVVPGTGNYFIYLNNDAFTQGVYSVQILAY